MKTKLIIILSLTVLLAFAVHAAHAQEIKCNLTDAEFNAMTIEEVHNALNICDWEESPIKEPTMFFGYYTTISYKDIEWTNTSEL